VIYSFDDAETTPAAPPVRDLAGELLASLQAPETPAPAPLPARCGELVWVEGTGAWVVEIDGEAMCEPMNGTNIGKWCAANGVQLAYTPRPPDDFQAYLDAQAARKRKGRSGS
jgi:hypothetical protein